MMMACREFQQIIDGRNPTSRGRW